MSASGFNESVNQTGGDQLLEFPLWKPILAINILLFLGLLAPSAIFFNISVFIALIKSKIKQKSMVVLYGSLLLGLCVDKLVICLSQIVITPAIIQFCICWQIGLLLFVVSRVFFTIYSVVIVTYQSVLQLLVLMGKKKWGAEYMGSVIGVVISGVVGVVWSIVFLTTSNDVPTLCSMYCEPPDPNSTVSSPIDTGLIYVGSTIVLTLIPSLIVTIVTSTRATILFKSKFMRRSDDDNDLNKKMILLPILMVFLVIANSTISYAVASIVGVILKRANLGAFFGNWAYFISIVVAMLIDIIHGVSYPVALVYLNTKLQTTWKRMLFKRGSRSNRVKPQDN